MIRNYMSGLRWSFVDEHEASDERGHFGVRPPYQPKRKIKMAHHGPSCDHAAGADDHPRIVQPQFRAAVTDHKREGHERLARRPSASRPLHVRQLDGAAK
jgi:hypothetical protein